MARRSFEGAESVQRVAVIGTGLIGGSIGLALRRVGIAVRGYDRDPDRVKQAAELGAVGDVASSVEQAVADADVAVVAVPVGEVAALVVEALDAGVPAVMDVGSVKAPVVAAVAAARPDLAPRFVGGHPMAGSEQDGLDGAEADLFSGATWVLTPTEQTEIGAFTMVRALVGELGAEVVAVTPEHHDALVAVVSHVPQLAATTLMDVAAASREEHATLLRLAASGFRDMTRIAAGHPGIWPDICVANREAIVRVLDDYLDALVRVRGLVDESDRASLLEVLERARAARRNLPVGTPRGEELAEVRVPVPDKPGVLAEVTTLAGSLGINIVDLEIAHSMEGTGGVLVLVIAARHADALERSLADRGYHSSRMVLP
jgi:prephenate dehydrogenase